MKAGSWMVLGASLLLLPVSARAEPASSDGSAAKSPASAGAAATSKAQATSAFSGAPFTVADADRKAAFQAAGFKLVGDQWRSGCEDPGTASYTPGAMEVQDVNKDGRPEIWITEGGVFCYGNTGQGFWLMARDSSDRWVTMIQDTGVHGTLAAVHHGWPDIEVGGPGFDEFPSYRFDGNKYVRSK